MLEIRKVKFSCGRPEALPNDVQEYVAVDLGFSVRKKSCGFAWWDRERCESTELRFGDAVDNVSTRIAGKKAVLIVEAPLSGLFDTRGNPCRRGDFELKKNGATKTSSRAWNCGPGAATCLAAVFFLRRLCAQLSRHTEPATITLFEGFVTFKQSATAHRFDAESLLKAYKAVEGFRPRWVSIPSRDGESIVNVLEVLGFDSPATAAPAILIPQLSP